MVKTKYFNPADPVNPVKNVSFTFDKIGNLKSYNDGTTQGQYQYDALYRKTSETVNYGSFSKSFQYDYYKNSLKKTYTDPAGIAYTYSYDPNNQLATIQIPDQGNITYQSYKWMRPTLIALPGGTKKEFEYDPLLRIKKITSLDPGQNVLLNYQYSYDKMDNIHAKTTEHGNYAYDYDDLYRLTHADNRQQITEDYSYDQVGNRLTSQSGVTVNWAYNQNNELQSYDGVIFQYDANGNTIQKITDNGQLVTVDYKYDIENRLIRVEDGTGQVIARYEYDPFGRRLWKEVDGQRTYFIYCDKGLAGELDQNGSLTKAYGYRPNSTWTTDPVFMREGESHYYYHNDHLGTPQKMTAQNGQVVWSAKYTAFGEAVIDSTSMITNNLRFPGQYKDEESGLHYNDFRYYDPRTGRYLTPDPIGKEGENNLFAYVENNPVNRIDPEGLRPLTACEKDKLRPYIPEEDLNNADLHTDRVPFYTPKWAGGITRGKRIYFRPGEYNSCTAGGLALLGHELLHVGQYRNGMTGLGYILACAKDYANCKYEKPAYALQKKIQDELTENCTGNGDCICP